MPDMAEILGIGLTPHPPLLMADEYMAFPLNMTLQRIEKVPEEMKNPTSWPEQMRVEYGEDECLSSAAGHRERLVNSFRVIRGAIEAFKPGFVFIWGDDQYENFKEDIIPPFCVLGYGQVEAKPFSSWFAKGRKNVWDEAEDKVFKCPGHSTAARYLVSHLTAQLGSAIGSTRIQRAGVASDLELTLAA